MKADCREFRERLADVADGVDVPGVDPHLESCAACQRELDVLKHMKRAFREPVYEPSVEAVNRAIRLMPDRPIRLARLVMGQMGAVRSVGVEEFQLVFEEEGIHARLMYHPLPNGWSVTGRVDGVVRSLEGPQGKLELEGSGRFHFEVRDLVDTDVYLETEAGIVKIPSAAEAASDGSESSS